MGKWTITRTSFARTKLRQSRANKHYCLWHAELFSWQNVSCYKCCGNVVNSNWHVCMCQGGFVYIYTVGDPSKVGFDTTCGRVNQEMAL